MSAKPPGLRPFLAADAPLLAEIFRASVETLAEDDYSDAQREAWVSAVDDEAAFAARLAGALTLVATIDGATAGFGSVSGGDRVDLLYVHPAFARRGVATAIVDAIERIAAARGAKSLTAEASDTARPLFAARGYEARSRNVRPMGEEWLANTTMVKTFAAEPKGTLQ